MKLLDCCVIGYVAMPEHVHLLISEPERSQLSVVIQMLKQITSRKLRLAGMARFWQFVRWLKTYENNKMKTVPM